MKNFLILASAFFCLAFLPVTEVQAQCPTQASVLVKTHTDVTCFGANDGTITVDLLDASTSEPFNFELVDLSIPAIVTASVTEVEDKPGRGVVYSNVPPGTYAVFFIKAGCGLPLAIIEPPLGFNVLEPAVLTITTPVVDPDCDPVVGSGNGQISLTVTGGNTPYTITWTGPTSIPNGTQNTAGNLDAGTYRINVTDAKNCTFFQDIPVPVSTLPLAGSDQDVCGTSATLAGNAAGGGETGTWTVSSGTGVFANANSPTTTVTGLSFGPNVFRWTITDNAALCPGNFDEVSITAFQPATVDAGPIQTICSGSSTAALGGSFGGSAASVTWTTSGDGTFALATDPNTIYTPGTNDRTAGTVTLTLTTNDPAGPCIAATDNVVITINPVATVDAGPIQTICASTSTAALGGSFGGSAVSASWTTSGDGTFALATNPNTTYTPGPNDIIAGTVTLTLTTNDPAGPCIAATDNVVITINTAATVDAGPIQTICSGSSTAALGGSFGGSAASVTWTTSGDGTFALATDPNTIYTPGTNDRTAGTVTLTLTTNDPAGPCIAATDNVVITINPVATVDAGPIQTICAGTSTAALGGSFGGGAASVTWSTSGDGTFALATNPNTTYTPGPNDIIAGTVTLTLTTNDPAGPCIAATDNVVITINVAATVDAGPIQTICSGSSTAALGGSFGGSAASASWTTSGDGTFALATDPNTIYTPGTNDRTAGTVTLTLTTDDPAGICPAATDNVVITINPVATVDAGPIQTICAGTSTAALGGSFGGGAASVTWSTSGDGTFTLATDPNTIYTPGTNDRTAGTVTLTLTTNDPAGPCIAATDNVVITINPVATVDAGPIQTICAGTSTAALGGSFGGSAVSASWTTSGDGTFALATNPNTTYTPGPNDIIAGTVTLTLTTNDPAGPCIAATDNVVITINVAATVDAGPIQTICSGSSTAALGGSFGGSAASVTWTTSGDGTFALATDPNTIYTPGTNDRTAGTVTLTLTTNDPAGPCIAATDNVVITINPVATVDAGPIQTICAGTSTAALGGSFGGGAASVTWSTSGDGTFALATNPNTTYTPGPNDIIAGTVTLTLTTNDPAGPCIAATDNVVITINVAATVDAGPIQTICSGSSTAALGGSFGGSAASASWTTSGDGTFALATDPNTIYTPGTNDRTAGTVTLTLTTDDPAGICPAATDNVVITINPVATVDAGPIQTICAGTSTAALGGSFGGGAASVTWSTSGDGTFTLATDPNTIYTPGTNDRTAGTVTLTLTTNDPAGPCIAATDNVVITINVVATVDAGPVQTICSGGSTAALGGSFGGSAASATWTTSGDGTFTLATDPNTIYTPGTNDRTNGTVTLTLTTDDPAGVCTSSSDVVVITINPAATVDAGSPQSVCAGGSVTLAGTRGGSAVASGWTTSGDGTFGNFSNLNTTYTPGVNDVANGTVTLTLTTNDPAGPCIAATDNVLITVINSANLNLPVAATSSTICSGGSTSITVGNSEVGVSYQLRNDAGNINVGAPVVGTGSTISLPTGALTVNTTFNVLTTAPGCPAVEQNTMATVTVAGNINVGLAVTAQASPICEGSSTNIQISNSENGVNYQLRNDAGDINIGAPVAGNGATISLPSGVLTATTAFNVLASNGTCSIELTDIETVIVNIVPDPSLTVAVTISPLCSGGTSEVTVALSEVGVSYQLRNDAGDINIGSPVVGTGATINLSTGALAANTTFNVLATSGVCTPVELTTTATVIVAGSINAGLTVTAQATPICEGIGTNIQVFSSENGVNYQLRNDADDSNVGGVVAGTGGTINLPTGALTVTTAFNILASNGTCSIQLTDIETVVVDVAPDPGLTVGVTIDPLCSGGTSEVTVALSEVGVSYQLRNDAGDINIGAPVAGTGGTINLSTGVLTTTTTFNVFASSGVCPSVELTTLATVNVAGSINAGLTLSASVNPICAGTSTNVQVQGSAAGVNYQLRNDTDDSLVGSPVAGTGGTINLPTGNLSATTTFNVLASNGTCAIELTSTQTITVNAGPNLSLAVSASPALICSGTASTITVANSEVGVSYQLRNNAGNALVGPAVVGTGSAINLPTGNLAVNTTFNVLATGSGCSAQLTNLGTVTIRPVGDPACSGGINCFAFTVTTVEQRPSCALQDDGSITFTINGGTPNYIVTLANTVGFNLALPGPGPNFTFTDLSPANYAYKIEDAAGNVCTLPYSLPLQTNVTADATGFVNATCFGQPTGQATITVLSGGASPYFYSLDSGGSWLSFTSPFTITNLPPNGTYSILVADDPSDQCPDEVTVTITNANPRIKGTFTSTNATCNGSDGAIDVTSTTGGAGGPYTFRLDGLSATEPFNNLSGGSHLISMIDNTGCARDTAIIVGFPGFVAYSAPATTIDATCTTKGVIGIFIPNPPGSYEIGFTTDPINQPTNYNAGFYNPATGLVIINKLDAGTYYVWIRTSSTSCPTRFENSPGVYEVIIGGPQPVSFDVGCRYTDGVLDLNNISASSSDPIFYEIFGNGFQKSGQITPNAIAHDTIHGFITGDYVIWLRQDQATFGCTVYSDTLSAPSGALDTLSVTKNESFPDQPTGSIRIRLRGSGAEPYEAWLVETAFNSDTLTAVRNPVIFEVNFSSLAAATYSLYIEDAAGCRKQYDIILPFDDTVFVPNVFTPNNDGVNELFYVRNLPSSGSKLSITNRWGKEVYSSNNYNPDNLWDGGGTPDGVYYYRLQISGGGTYTGWVEIVRGVKP